MDYDKLANRIGIILTKLFSGERASVKELAEEFNTSPRTIYRDIKERLQYLEILKDKNGRLYLDESYIGKVSFEDIRNFALISGIKAIFPKLSNEFIKDILNHRIKTFEIKNSGFENIESKTNNFIIISDAIANNQKLQFIYKDKEKTVSPYKLQNINNVWYLACDDGSQILKTYAFSKIENLELMEDKFKPLKKLLEDLNSKDNFISKDKIVVQIEILNSAKDYFYRKEVFKKFKLIQELENSFIISTETSFEDEVLNTVKYWIPYMKIVSPKSLKDRLDGILKEYLAR